MQKFTPIISRWISLLILASLIVGLPALEVVYAQDEQPAVVVVPGYTPV